MDNSLDDIDFVDQFTKRMNWASSARTQSPATSIAGRQETTNSQTSTHMDEENPFRNDILS